MGDVIEVWNPEELEKTMMDEQTYGDELEMLMADKEEKSEEI